MCCTANCRAAGFFDTRRSRLKFPQIKISEIVFHVCWKVLFQYNHFFSILTFVLNPAFKISFCIYEGLSPSVRVSVTLLAGVAQARAVSRMPVKSDGQGMVSAEWARWTWGRGGGGGVGLDAEQQWQGCRAGWGGGGCMAGCVAVAVWGGEWWPPCARFPLHPLLLGGGWGGGWRRSVLTPPPHHSCWTIHWYNTVSKDNTKYVLKYKNILR